MIQDPPILMVIHDVDVQRLSKPPYPETGMDLQVVVTQNGPIAVLSDGAALPCYPGSGYYDLADLLAGTAAPQRGQANFSLPGAFSVMSSRIQARRLIGLAATGPVTPTAPAVGAHPLLARRRLASPATFLRYISLPKDLRFTGSNLLPSTYLTTALESGTANSGFAAVGRFALPLPIPTRTVIEYELPATSVVDVGTVAPLFGQSGGGVEICVVSSPSASQTGTRPLPEY